MKRPQQAQHEMTTAGTARTVQAVQRVQVIHGALQDGSKEAGESSILVAQGCRGAAAAFRPASSWQAREPARGNATAAQARPVAGLQTSPKPSPACTCLAVQNEGATGAGGAGRGGRLFSMTRVAATGPHHPECERQGAPLPSGSWIIRPPPMTPRITAAQQGLPAGRQLLAQLTAVHLAVGRSQTGSCTMQNKWQAYSLLVHPEVGRSQATKTNAACNVTKPLTARPSRSWASRGPTRCRPRWQAPSPHACPCNKMNDRHGALQARCTASSGWHITGV